ncbi:MAG TPA: large conductance mechanosensitive channel protein MscL [Gemmataceae bacterium]|jgi:large conductance mechanosensitive channel
MNPLDKIRDFEPAKKAWTFLDEFKAFALKGNVIDLAIGVIIGAAFGTIVSSLVSDIIMPVVTMFLPPDQEYKSWVIAGRIRIGSFLAAVVNFLIVALALYVFIVKFVGWLTRLRKDKAAAPPPTKDQELLMEIRDLLRQQVRPTGGAATGVPGPLP